MAARVDPAGLPLALTLRLLLPFACGYFLSYLYRNVNAVIEPDLVASFALDASDLGLLTSVYFLAFALFQLPLGVLLDRFGPRRVEAVLLLIAASGALLFATSEGRAGLIAGRALIGLGVSSCLMASFKATASWFPAAQVPAMNSWIMVAGGLGALTATRPVAMALSVTDWRGVLLTVAALTCVVAIVLFTVVPERGRYASSNLKDLLGGVVKIYRTAFFWRVVPLTVSTQAAFLAIQGLWAGPWLRDVAQLERTAVANHLLLIAAAMMAGFLVFGQTASRLARVGISLATTMGVGLAIFLLVQLCLALGWGDAALPLWLAFGFFGGTGILAFPLLAQHFSGDLTGRVNTAANVLVFLSAFAAQWMIGAVIELWPQDNGYQLAGYRAAFGLALTLQALAFAWYLSGMRRRYE